MHVPVRPLKVVGLSAWEEKATTYDSIGHKQDNGSIRPFRALFHELAT